jgi:hypothetical protein
VSVFLFHFSLLLLSGTNLRLLLLLFLVLSVSDDSHEVGTVSDRLISSWLCFLAFNLQLAVITFFSGYDISFKSPSLVFMVTPLDVIFSLSLDIFELTMLYRSRFSLLHLL